MRAQLLILVTATGFLGSSLACSPPADPPDVTDTDAGVVSDTDAVTDAGTPAATPAVADAASVTARQKLLGTPHARLEPQQAGANAGFAAASAGDVNGDGFDDVIVGAHLYDGGETDEGAAFVFLGSPSGIAHGSAATAHARLQSDQAGAWFGRSVASAGDVNGDGFDDVIVGAELFDNGETDEGAAFVFLGSPSGMAHGSAATAHARLESDQATAYFGSSVASAGDVNGDGYDDVIVGARLFDAGEADEGAAFVFLGSASGLASGGPASTHATIQSNQAGAQVGFSVASAGDVNRDGFDDVITGARVWDGGQTDEGGAFLFLGSASGLASGDPSSASARFASGQAEAWLGSSVASAGDVNGDGFDDLIVGARNYDTSSPDAGAAFVFLGSASGIPDGRPDTAHAGLRAEQAGAQLGFSVASAGDVDGDGFGDVIVGAWFHDADEADEGAAFVFLGSATGLADATPARAHAQVVGTEMNARLGARVASAGDVNADGHGDLLVGVPLFDVLGTDDGVVLVFLGSPRAADPADPDPAVPAH